MKNAPAPNKVKSQMSGRLPGAAAKPILHVQGQYNNQVPKNETEKKSLLVEDLYM